MVGYRIEDDDLYEFKLEYRTIVVASINEMLVLGGSLEYTGDFGGVSEDLEFFDSISDILKDSNGNAQSKPSFRIMPMEGSINKTYFFNSDQDSYVTAMTIIDETSDIFYFYTLIAEDDRYSLLYSSVTKAEAGDTQELSVLAQSRIPVKPAASSSLFMTPGDSFSSSNTKSVLLTTREGKMQQFEYTGSKISSKGAVNIWHDDQSSIYLNFIKRAKNSCKQLYLGGIYYDNMIDIQRAVLSRQWQVFSEHYITASDQEWSESTTWGSYLDVQVASGCEEVFAVRNSDENVLKIDNFVLEKTFEVGESGFHYRFLGTYCPEDEALGSENYKCQMGVVHNDQEDASSILYFEFYPYWAADASFKISQVRWIQPQFKIPAVTTLLDNNEFQEFYGFTSQSNLAFMGTQSSFYFVMPWLSDESRNRFSVIGSALKDSDCIDAYAHVDQFLTLEEETNRWKWITESDYDVKEHSPLDGKYYMSETSSFIDNDSSNHCSGLCHNYSELIEFGAESSDQSSTDCDYTITVNDDTLFNDGQIEFAYEVNLNEAHVQQYFFGGIGEWVECEGQQLHTSLVFYGTEEDEDLELTDLLMEDFTCEDYSQIDHNLSLNDCYKVELIREIKETFTIFNERLGIGEFKVETDKIEHVGLVLNFTMNYSFDYSLTPTKTKYFQIFTTLSQSSIDDVQIQPWLEQPPEQFYELSVDDEQIRVDIGQPVSQSAYASFEVTLTFTNYQNYRCSSGDEFYVCPIQLSQDKNELVFSAVSDVFTSQDQQQYSFLTPTIGQKVEITSTVYGEESGEDEVTINLIKTTETVTLEAEIEVKSALRNIEGAKRVYPIQFTITQIHQEYAIIEGTNEENDETIGENADIVDTGNDDGTADPGHPSDDASSDSTSTSSGPQDTEEKKPVYAQVLDVTEDAVDGEEAVQFDIFEFLANLNRPGQKAIEGISDDTPPIIVQHKMEDLYLVPRLTTVNMFGEIVFEFSSQIVKPDPKDIQTGLENAGKLRKLQEAEESTDEQVEYTSIEELLKDSGSIVMTLESGSETNLELKAFDWTVEKFTENELGLKLKFEHPQKISIGIQDVMHISFHNTQSFLKTKDEELETLPEGFQTDIPLPTQAPEILNQEQAKIIATQGKLFVASNIASSIYFAQTIQMLFGSIIVFQILAHMPLANIMLPANSMQAFEIMAEVVSFDYFQVFDHWDVGFTPTDPFRVNFEWLGYESLNFLEGMGSISILILAGLAYILLMTILRAFKCKEKCKTIEKISAPLGLLHKALNFTQGTFFEIILCASVGMKMFSMLEYLNGSDKVAIACQIIAAFILMCFVIFVLYFTLIEGPRMVGQNQYNNQKHNQELIQQVRSVFKSQHKKRHSIAKMRESVMKLASQEADIAIKKSNDKYLKLKERFNTVQMSDRANFEMYKPLYSGFRDTSRLALMQNILLIARRMALLYVAMFLPDKLFLQLITFLISSLLAISYNLYVRPFISEFEGRINLVNEFIILTVTYFLICVASFQDSSNETGEMIVGVIWLSWVVNGLVVLYLSITEVYSKLRRCFLRRKAKNLQKSKQDKAQQDQDKRKAAPGNSIEVSSVQPKPLHVFPIGASFQWKTDRGGLEQVDEESSNTDSFEAEKDEQNDDLELGPKRPSLSSKQESLSKQSSPSELIQTEQAAADAPTKVNPLQADEPTVKAPLKPKKRKRQVPVHQFKQCSLFASSTKQDSVLHASQDQNREQEEQGQQQQGQKLILPQIKQCDQEKGQFLIEDAEEEESNQLDPETILSSLQQIKILRNYGPDLRIQKKNCYQPNSDKYLSYLATNIQNNNQDSRRSPSMNSSRRMSPKAKEEVAEDPQMIDIEAFKSSLNAVDKKAQFFTQVRSKEIDRANRQQKQQQAVIDCDECLDISFDSARTC